MQEDSKILLDKVAKNLSNEKISNNKDKKSFGDDHGEYGKFYLPRRFILAVLLFGVCMLMNCQRSCLSVAIVAMSSDTKYWDDGKWKIQVGWFNDCTELLWCNIRYNSKCNTSTVSAWGYGVIVCHDLFHCNWNSIVAYIESLITSSSIAFQSDSIKIGCLDIPTYKDGG